MNPTQEMIVPMTTKGLRLPNFECAWSESLPNSGNRMSPSMLSDAMMSPCQTEFR